MIDEFENSGFSIKMVPYLSQEIIDIVKKIYEDLILDATENEDYIFWDHLSQTSDMSGGRTLMDCSISHGYAGYLLFMVMYYNAFKEEKTLKDCYKVGNWILHEKDTIDHRNRGFYDGSTGVSYALTKLYEISHEEKYLDGALSIMAPVDNAVFEKGFCNFAQGVTGYAFMMMLLNQYKPDQFSTVDFERIVLLLLKKARLNENGIYWDADTYARHPLIGFPYGNSGIAYVLSKLATHFDSDFLASLSSSAMNFERTQFNAKLNNWPDYLNAIALKTLSQTEHHHKAALEQYVDSVGYHVCWQNGALSVGLGELALMTDANVEQVKRAAGASNDYLSRLDNIKNEINLSLELGLSGMVLSAIAINNALDQAAPFSSNEIFDIIKERIVKTPGAEILPEDIALFADKSFFNGSMGLGYMICLLHSDHTNDHICYPELTLKKTTEDKLSYSQKDLLHYLVKKYFPKTLELVPESIDLLHDLDIDPTDHLSNVHQWCTAMDGLLNHQNNIVTQWTIEKTVFSRTLKNPNIRRLKLMHQNIEKQNGKLIDQLTEENITRRKFKLTDYVEMVQENEAFALLIEYPTEIKWKLVNQAVYLVMTNFQEPTRVIDVIKRLSTSSDEQEKEQISIFVKKQVFSLIRNNLIQEVKKSGLSGLIRKLGS